MTSKTKTALIAAFLVTAASAAFAQSNSARFNNDTAVAPAYNDQGELRGTAYGAGGTAGTHPTGANVGPGRAAMDHTTGS